MHISDNVYTVCVDKKSSDIQKNQYDIMYEDYPSIISTSQHYLSDLTELYISMYYVTMCITKPRK